MEKLSQVNLYIIIGVVVLLILGGGYFFIYQKEQPSSIDDFIKTTQTTKSPVTKKISSKNLKKLESTKVEEIDTKDPFIYQQKQVNIGKVVTGVTANIPLDQLKFVGILTVGPTRFAIIELPDKKVYKFTTNEYISKDAAKIQKITNSELILLESRQDITGTWITDKRVLKLKQEVKENL